MIEPPKSSSHSVVYRYRGEKALIHEHHELERQEIYLAAPSDLNDPMEGYLDGFWKGDAVLWENLIRHYLLCLLWTCGDCLAQEDETFSPPSIPADLDEEQLPTERFRSMYRQFTDSVFAEPVVARLPELMAGFGAPLRRAGLKSVLETLHHLVLPKLIQYLNESGLARWPDLQLVPAAVLLEGLEAVARISQRQDRDASMDLEIMGEVSVMHQRQLSLMHRLNGNDGRTEKLLFLMSEFPNHYEQALTASLMYANWYTACFSATAENASMWSIYANAHRGAALIFKTYQDSDGKQSLRLHGIPGTGGNGHQQPLEPVRYGSAPPSLDLFLSMGRLSEHRLSNWFARAGVWSSRWAELNTNQNLWRQNYWEQFRQLSTFKHSDWQHEQERRVVINDFLGTIGTAKAVTYDFMDLQGIIFGARMTTSDQLKIIKIVKGKCDEATRTDFQFFQAEYSSVKGGISVRPLSLLKLSGTRSVDN